MTALWKVVLGTAAIAIGVIYYVVVTFMCIRAVHFRWWTALGVRGNDEKGDYEAYHRHNEQHSPYWPFIFGSFIAPFRIAIFLCVLTTSYSIGMMFGWLQLLMKPTNNKKESLNRKTEHWTVKGRVLTDMYGFQIMLGILQFQINHYQVVDDENQDPSTSPTSSKGHNKVANENTHLLGSGGKKIKSIADYFVGSDGKSYHNRTRSKTKLVVFPYSEIYKERVNGDLSRRGTLIPNHIAVWDSFLFGTISPSFVAFADFVPAPIKFYGQFNKVILLDIDKENGREKAKKQIIDFQKEALHNPVNTAPLVLFAEGTSTSGRCIMPFKDGAFQAGLSVQPIILKYSKNNEANCYDTWTLGTDSIVQNILISTLDFRPSKCIDVIWMTPMTPKMDEPMQDFKFRVYDEMNLMLSTVQPNCLPDLPVWNRFSHPHTHEVKKEGFKYQKSIYKCRKNKGFWSGLAAKLLN